MADTTRAQTIVCFIAIGNIDSIVQCCIYRSGTVVNRISRYYNFKQNRLYRTGAYFYYVCRCTEVQTDNDISQCLKNDSTEQIGDVNKIPQFISFVNKSTQFTSFFLFLCLWIFLSTKATNIVGNLMNFNKYAKSNV